MRVLLSCFYAIIVSLILSLPAGGQIPERKSPELLTRCSFYSWEKKSEFLLHLPPSMVNVPIEVKASVAGNNVASWKGKSSGRIVRIPFAIDVPAGSYNAQATISVQQGPVMTYKTNTNLLILKYKPNEVKTDRLTGGLIVNRLPFFPFGFYCYSPVPPEMPAEEAIRGFNMFSPYQKILPETLNERKAYMDRCAEIGMKVHYNLLSLSGGGGVGSKIEGLTGEEKRKRLVEEIMTFRDHPALLAWYIADEPTAKTMPPEKLEDIYRIVRENDPWHPVTVVFMTPFLTAAKYSAALDIVMADPYPVPDLPVSFVGDVTAKLRKEFEGKKPVWMVQQAFGGGEIWSREPTLQEIRSMTWQAIIKGAGGIQYFVRQGPSYFPKSAATWNECGRMAVEIAELTPWLLTDEDPVPVESLTANVIATSRLRGKKLVVMAVNQGSRPASCALRIGRPISGQARCLFENRFIEMSGGVIRDQLGSYGSQAYLIDLAGQDPGQSDAGRNILKDGGFEDLTSPGIPSACYVRPGGDKGATFFLDGREYIEGGHSLRLVTPTPDKGVSVRFFPFRVSAGSSYIISVWAKTDPEQRTVKDRVTGVEQPQYAEVALGSFARARFVPDSEWRRYITFLKIPEDTTASFKTNLILKMPGQGVAWFDDIKVYEE